MMQRGLTMHAQRAVRLSRASTRRFASSSGSGESPSPLFTHVAAGMAGGFVVVGAGYAYYRSSDLYTWVQKAKQASRLVEETRSKVTGTSKSIVQETKKVATSQDASFSSPTQVIGLIRQTITPMVASIPGATEMVDQSLSTLEKYAKENAKEAEQILRETYDQLKRVFKEAEGQLSLTSAHQAYTILHGTYQRVKDKMPSSVGEATANMMPDKMDLLKELSKATPALKELLQSDHPLLSNVKDVLNGMSLPQATKWVEGLKDRIASASQKHAGATDAILKEVQAYMREALPANVSKALPSMDKVESVKQLWQNWEKALPESLRDHPKLKEYMSLAQQVTKEMDVEQVQTILKAWTGILKEKASLGEMHQQVKPVLDQIKKINEMKKKDEDISGELKTLLHHLANPKK